MLAAFGFQNMLEVVTTRLAEPGRNVTKEQQQKLNSKARFLMYQCVTPKIFNKISNVSTSKDAWAILVKIYGDGEKNKKGKDLRSANGGQDIENSATTI
ncbi:hypothetical protein CR513_53916, partial [Mucuna pruriens]